MTWNYRVCRELLDDGTEHHSIREVYYDADGKIKAWSVDPIAPAGENLAEIVVELARMTEATQKDVLDVASDCRPTRPKGTP